MITKAVDMPSPTGAIRKVRLTVNPASRRPVAVLVQVKGGRLSNPLEDVWSVRLAISYLGLLVIYKPVTSFIHGGNMDDLYVRYAQVVIFFALLGLAFFCWMVWDIIRGFAVRYLWPKKP